MLLGPLNVSFRSSRRGVGSSLMGFIISHGVIVAKWSIFIHTRIFPQLSPTHGVLFELRGRDLV